MLTELKAAGEFILREVDPVISRENITVTVAAGARLVAGTVLAQLTADSKYVPYDNVGADGSETAAGILYSEVDNTEGGAPADFKGVAVVRLAAVRKDGLEWAAGVDAAGKTAAYADLAAKFVIARD